MRKFTAIAACAVTAACAHAPARAGDGLFSGPFVGVQAGIGRRTIDAYNIDEHRSGIDYSAFAGLDLHLGSRIVVGGEGDIGDGGRTLSRNFAGVGPTRANPGRNWSVSGRAGFLAMPELLVYGRLGYGSERLRATFSNSTPSLLQTTPDGTLYGGGAEYALGRRISLRAEYRYLDFDGSYHPQQFLVGAAFRF